MSRSVVNDAIAEASVGLPPDMAEGLRRYLHGRHRGGGGRTLPRDKLAERLRTWLETRRAEDAVRRVEEAGAIAWLGRLERTATR